MQEIARYIKFPPSRYGLHLHHGLHLMASNWTVLIKLVHAYYSLVLCGRRTWNILCMYWPLLLCTHMYIRGGLRHRPGFHPASHRYSFLSVFDRNAPDFYRNYLEWICLVWWDSSQNWSIIFVDWILEGGRNECLVDLVRSYPKSRNHHRSFVGFFFFLLIMPLSLLGKFQQKKKDNLI